MKKRAILLGLVLCSVVTTNAQLLNKLNKAKNTANQASEVVETVEKGKEAVKKGDKSKKGGGGGFSAGLKLDWTQFKQTPAITMSSLLYGTTAGTINSYTATFIPNKTVSGKTVNAFSDQSEYLRIKVFKNNQYMNYFEYSGDQVFDDGKKTKFNEPSSRYQHL